MAVECSNGERFLVYDDMLINHEGCMRLKDYSDSLIYCDAEDRDWDIVRVFKHINFSNGVEWGLKFPVGILWTREEKKIDWSKVPKWTKIEVRIGENNPWYGAYFLEVDERLNKYVVTFHDKFVFEHGTNDIYLYSEIRLYDKKDFKKEWLKGDK